MHTIWVFLSLATLCPVVATAQAVIGFDSTGRSLVRPVQVSGSVRVEIIGAPGEEAERAKYQVRFKYVAAPDQPFLLTEADQQLTAVGADSNGTAGLLVYNIPRGSKSNAFLIVNIWKQTNLPLSAEQVARIDAEISKVQAEINKVTEAFNIGEGAAIPGLLKKIAALQSGVTEDPALKETVERLNAEKEARRREIDALVRIPSEKSSELVKGIQLEIRRIESDIESIEQKRRDEERKRKQDVETLQTQAAVLDAKRQTQLMSLNEKLASLQGSVNGRRAPTYDVLAISGLIVGEKRRAVYYSFELGPRGTDAARPFTLRRLGEPPVLYRGDQAWVTIVNRQLAAHPAPFTIAVEVAAGTPINSTPVRPTFDIKLQAGRDEPRYNSTEAYVDYVIPIGRTLAGDEILKVTLSTYLRHRTSDTRITKTETGASTEKGTGTVTEQQEDKSEVVDLIAKDQWPQVRPLYVYNLAAGVFGSRLSNPSFVKVLSVANDPTTDANETRYRIETRNPGDRVMPTVAFSWAYVPVDTQRGLSWRDLLPRPTLAFSLTSPADDMFGGISLEIVRNTHVFVGVHYGKVKRIVPRADVGEDSVETPPLTDEKRDTALALGLSFNIGFIKELFGK